MTTNTKLRKRDELKICGSEYQLIENLSQPLRGFQFRTWRVRRSSDRREFVAKITPHQERALNEIRVYIYLKTRNYPERYYAEMVAFDHQALLTRKNQTFYVILLKYLQPNTFQALDIFLRRGRLKKDKSILKKITNKLEKRVDQLHELGISHGDIRQKNMMVNVRETKRVGVRLIDFGLSKFGDKEEIEKDKENLQKITVKIANN